MIRQLALPPLRSSLPILGQSMPPVTLRIYHSVLRKQSSNLQRFFSVGISHRCVTHGEHRVRSIMIMLHVDKASLPCVHLVVSELRRFVDCCQYSLDFDCAAMRSPNNACIAFATIYWYFPRTYYLRHSHWSSCLPRQKSGTRTS